MTVLLFIGKFYRVKGRFLQQNEIKEDHFKRSKIDNLDLHRKRSFVDQ